jgi:hypothetical protein
MSVMPELFYAGFTQTKEYKPQFLPQIAVGSHKKNPRDYGAIFK